MTTPTDARTAAALDAGDIDKACMLAAGLPKPYHYIRAMAEIKRIVTEGMRMTDPVREALGYIEELIADVEGKRGDPHTLRWAKSGLETLRAALAAAEAGPDDWERAMSEFEDGTGPLTPAPPADASADDLVARLQAWKDLAAYADGGWNMPWAATAALDKVTGQAATAIVALTAEVARLTTEKRAALGQADSAEMRAAAAEGVIAAADAMRLCLHKPIKTYADDLLDAIVAYDHARLESDAAAIAVQAGKP